MLFNKIRNANIHWQHSFRVNGSSTEDFSSCCIFLLRSQLPADPYSANSPHTLFVKMSAAQGHSQGMHWHFTYWTLHAQWLEKLFCSLVGLFQQFIIGAQEGTVELPLGNSYINPACWKCCCRQVICPGDVFLQESYQGFFCSVNVIPLFFLPTKLFTYCCSSLAFQQSRQDHHPGVSLSTVMEPLSWTNICLPYPVHHL